MRRLTVLSLALLAALLSGCVYAAQQTAEAENCYQLYFMAANLDEASGGDALTTECCAVTLSDQRPPEELAAELMNHLLAGPAEETLCSPFPTGTALLGVEVSGAHALVDLTSSYTSLSGVALSMADYCITLTLTQVPAIRTVSVTVRGQELAYRDSHSFAARDVLLSSTEDVVGTVEVTLFFVGESGGFSTERRTLELYEGDTQAECVLAALEQGPERKGLAPVLPENFAPQTVWMEEDTCYVNLATSALSKLPEGTNLAMPLEAIARSLLSLDTVTEVRFLSDGELVQNYGGVEIDGPFLAS